MIAARASAAAVEPGFQLLAVAWERVQLAVRIGGPPASLAALQGLGLSRVDRPRDAVLEPAAMSRSAEAIDARFHIMAGPGLRPLDRGTWVLSCQSGAGRAPLVLHIDPTLAMPEGHSYRLTHVRYDASVVSDRDAGLLELDIAIDPFGGRIPRRWPAWRIGRGRIDELRASIERLGRRLFVSAARLSTRRSGRRVVFASAGRGGLTGNLKVVRDRMVERGLDREFDLVTIGRTRRGSAVGHWRDRWSSARSLLGAEAILVAGSLQRAVYGLTYDRDVRFIQLWHASGAFKTVGFTRPGQADAPDPFARVHKSYTHAIVGSEHDVPFYAEAFGIPESRVVVTGLPRMDRFFDPRARAAGIDAAYDAFPMLRGHQVWLFAPTYRGEARAATYAFDLIDFAALHRLAVERDAVVVLKMHPFVTAPIPVPPAYAERLIDATRTRLDVNDLLFVVDLLVTDYSSIIFEFSTLGRPMCFFAYDLDDYTADRDFYVPFESFVPGPIVRTFSELLEAMGRAGPIESARADAFARRHFAHRDGHAADRVIDLAIRPMDRP